jgi:VCBS repeat-containing protein
MSALETDDSATVSQQQTFTATTLQQLAFNSTPHATALAAPNTAAIPTTLPATINNVATTLAATLFAPFLAPPSTPLAPAERPLLWAVLGWVRREVQRTFVNHPPDAINDAFTTSEDRTTTGNVLTNDTDADGDPLKATLVTGPQHGALTLGPDGSFSYTPTADYTGTDTFTYKLSDDTGGFHLHGLLGFLRPGGGHTDTATVTITVTPVNDAPAADNDTYTVVEDGVLTVGGPGVLGNDTDVDNTPAQLSAVLGAGPSHGTLALNPDGSFTYTPTANFNGADSFTYRASDGVGSSSPATVNITVTAVNDAPVANSDTATTAEDNSVTIAVLVNDIDVENSPLTPALASQPTNGIVLLNPDKTYTYTPNSGFSGTDSFTYNISDGTATSNTATVSITVTPSDTSTSGPIVGTPEYAVDAIDNATGVVRGHVNVTDPGSDHLIFAIAEPITAEVGVVTVDEKTGNWTFRPSNVARLNAWTTAASDTITFAINVTDSETPAVTVNVTAPITPAAHSALENILGAEQESWGNQGLAIGPDGRYYMTTYMVDDTAGEVVVLNPDGTYATTIHIADAIPYPFATAYDVAVGPDGRVFVSSEVADTLDELSQEAARGVVVVINPHDGYSVALFAEIPDPASAITTDSAGHVFVANWNNDTVTVLNADGTVNALIESAELFDGDDSGVAGLAVGPGGQLYLTKPGLGVVKVVSPDGALADTIDIGGLDGEPWAIAVAANGALYVTDFNHAGLTVIDADGPVRTVTLESGASPSDVTIGADGIVYVPYLGSNGGAIAIVTAVPVAGSDATAIGDPITGSPGTTDNPTGPVVAGDVVYQATTSIDPATGLPTTTVAVIGANGATTLVYAPGEQAGAPVLGPGDVAYQTVSYFDDTTGGYLSGVLAVTPTGGHTFTGLFAGQPVGAVVFGSSGTVYQVLNGEGAAPGTYTTTVLVISPSGATPHTVAGSPGSLAVNEPSGPVSAADGTVYLTTTDFDGTDFTTTLSVLGPEGVTPHSIAGFASGPVTIAPDGTVHQTIGSIETDPDTGAITVTAAVAVLTAAGLVALPDTLTGLPLGSPVVAGDNMVYQTVFVISADPGTTTNTTTVAAITATGLTPVIDGIPGSPTGWDGSLIPLVVGSDGTVYQTITYKPDPDTDSTVTLVASISPIGTVYGGSISGEPVGAVAAGIDGVAYQTTYDAATNTTRVGVITAAGTTIHEFIGYPGNPDSTTPTPVVVGPDGTAYQVIAASDPITGEYTTTVAVITADDVTSSSVAGLTSGAVVFGPDGRGYLTIGMFDRGAQSVLTTVVAVDPNSLTPVGDTIRGNPAGALEFGSDGAVYQTVFGDNGSGSITTTLHVIDTTEPAITLSITSATATLADPAIAAKTQVAPVQSVAATALSATSKYTYIIDDAYLAPFLAADPTGRFNYTQTITSPAMRGLTVDQTPMSNTELADWLEEARHYLTLTGSAGFARDSQGRLTYHNTFAQDVLVVYGARPDTIARGALLARPGQTVTLPAGPEGLFAAAQLPGQPGQYYWDAVVYRGATPVQETKPKTSATTSTQQQGIKVADLLPKISTTPDTIRIDKIVDKGITRVVVYISGVKDPSLQNAGSYNAALRAKRGIIDENMNDTINKAIGDIEQGGVTVSEIMLVGYSKGGMTAQNYAAKDSNDKYNGKYGGKVTTVITFASPLVKKANEYGTNVDVLHLEAKNDYVPRDEAFGGVFVWADGGFHAQASNRGVRETFVNNTADWKTIYVVDTGTKYSGNAVHERPNYTLVAQNYDTNASRWEQSRRITNDINRFLSGTVTTIVNNKSF